MDNPHFDDPLRCTNDDALQPPQEQQAEDQAAAVATTNTNTVQITHQNPPHPEPTSLLQNEYEPPVMGGTIGSHVDYMDHPSSRRDNDDVKDDSNDPGIITDLPYTPDALPSHFGTRRGEPIVIDAEKWIEEAESSRRQNQEKHSGVIQSLFKNPFSVVSSGGSGAAGTGGGSSSGKEKNTPRNKTLDAHMKAAHEDYKRKYQGIPFDKDAAAAAAVSSTSTASSPYKYRTLEIEPCRAKFLVTKVRSWRTGYCRILSLHRTYFTTIDPETHEITNLWYYSQIRHCLALPQEEDCILMDVLEDPKGVVKLKFKCLPTNRNEVITALMENMYLLEMDNASSSLMQQSQQHVIFPNCQRWTRHHTREDCSLLCAPHGILEMDRGSGLIVRTYYYKCIRSVCFLGDDVNGIVLYMNETNHGAVVSGNNSAVRCECKVWFVESSRVGGSGRSDIFTVLKNKFAALAMPWNMSESIDLSVVNEIRKSRGTTSLVGEWIGRFRVQKFSQRRVCKSQTKEDEKENVDLILTRGGYILEVDFDGGVKSSRSLRDVMCVVKHSDVTIDVARVDTIIPPNKFTIEFKGGLQRTYSSDERDTVIVSILDITIYTCKNFDVTVTDVPSCGYSMLCFSEKNSLKDSSISTAEKIFQPDPIDSQCLKLLHDVSTVTNANIQHICFVNDSVESRVLVNECVALIECCREFNANVRVRDVKNLPDDKKLVGGSINSLWDLCLYLLEYVETKNDQKEALSGTGQIADDTEQVVNVLVPIFQTLYRLMMTEVGYSTTAENKEMVSCVESILEIKDNLALYWFLKCLSALLLPRPFVDDRDKRNEFVNKNILLETRTGISSTLVSVIMGTPRHGKKYGVASRQFVQKCSDLVIMVASNIIESILCSHQETTPSERGNELIHEIRQNQYIILDMLNSSAAIIIENGAVTLQILACRCPDAAKMIRHSALISGMLLNHFYRAIFSVSEGQRHISRLLCTLWMSGHSGCAEKLLLHRLVPSGFFHYLSMPRLSDEEENQLEEMEKGEHQNDIQLYRSELTVSSGTNIERFRSRMIKARSSSTNEGSDELKENFRIFFHVINQEHSLPDLIWNDSTRNDLRIALESELKLINAEVEQYGRNKVAWNYEQFAVDYSSLKDEVRVGSVYMRLWLETSDSFIRSWEDPVRLLEHLFRRLLCDIDKNAAVANICIRCLERLYAIHFKKIGTFPDILILFRCMRTTENIETRHRLFSLLMMLIGSKDDCLRVTECGGNLSQFLNQESIQFFCLLTAETHFDPDSFKKCNFSTNPPALWYIAPPGSKVPAHDSVDGPFTIEDLKVKLRNGEINRLHRISVCVKRKRTVSDNVNEWEELQNVWQLRRQLLDDETPSFSYTPSTISTLSLRALEKLVLAHDDTDSRGIPYFPIPLAKRLICGDALDSLSARQLQGLRFSSLSIICQCILSQDRDVVNSAANLIRHLMSHNEVACRTLYLTGVFFFAFTSDLSDWNCIAQMIHETILTQRGTSLKNERPSDRVEDVISILRQMMPAGLVQVLINHGPKQFAEVFGSDYDTPEVIWSREMRKYLRSMLLEHIGDFPARLRENCILHYDYRPLQTICYDRLQNEVFCYNYYLGNLCDEKRFCDWPISDPLAFLNACIELWESLEKQVSDNEMISMDETIPSRPLHVDANQDDRNVLQKCHGPYKDVKDAHMISRNSPKLTSESLKKVSNGEDYCIDEKLYQFELLMKAQILICKRYPEEIGNFKYSAYRMLLSLVKRKLKNDGENHCTARFIHTAMSLAFYSCLVSPLNAEELIREGGVLVLADVLRTYVYYASSLGMVKNLWDDSLSSVYMETLVDVVHTIAGISYYESGRTALESLPDLLDFLYKWRLCVDLHSLGEKVYGCNLLKRYALEGVINMAKTKGLQRVLSQSGIVWNLLHCCLDYDPSINLSSPDTNQCETSLSKVELNYCGGLAARALGMLCGVMHGDFSSPSNQSLFDLMKHILTPPIATMLRSSNTEKLLRTLNVDIKSPIRMWDIKMKDELKTFVSHMEATQRTSNKPSFDLDVVNNFQYSNLSDQIIIGGVYVRMFNNIALTESIKEIPSMPVFVRSVLKFIGRSVINDVGDCDAIDRDFVESYPINSSTDDPVDIERESIWFPVTDDKFIVCITAVLLLSRADGLFDEILCETSSAGILLSLMRVDSKLECFPIAIDILAELCPKQTFAEAILNRGLIPWYLTLLEFQQCHDSSEDICKKNPRWSVLELLSSSSAVASHLVSTSGWLELLAVLVGCERFSTIWSNRNGSAQVLARLLCDPQVSSIAVSKLQKFIPPGLVTTLKENGAEAMILAFDEDTESPQLIWDKSMRLELRNIISDFMSTIFDADDHRVAPNSVFSLPIEFHCDYHRLKGELCLGGVYVRLFLKLHSSCQLQDPTGFLEALLFRWATEMEFAINRSLDIAVQDDCDKSSVIDLVTEATSLTFELFPFLCQKLTSLGYTKQIVQVLFKSKLNNLIGIHLISSIRLLLALSTDLAIVEDVILLTDSEGKNGVVDGVMKAIDGNPLHCETALMVEALKLFFKTALGDVDNCHSIANLKMSCNYDTNMKNALTPSPASGKESVSKMKLDAADHPLAMFESSSAPSAKNKSISVRPCVEKHLTQRERYRNLSSTTVPSAHPKTSRVIQRHNAEKTLNASKKTLAQIVTTRDDAINFPIIRHLNTSNLPDASIMESKKPPSEWHNHVVDNFQSRSSQEGIQQPEFTNNIIHTSPFTQLGKSSVDGGDGLKINGENENSQNETKAFLASRESHFSNPLLHQSAMHMNKHYIGNHTSDFEAFPPYAMTSNSVDDFSSCDPSTIAQSRMNSVAGAPNSAKGRHILLNSALTCELPQFLVNNVLENSRFEYDVKDNKSTEFHVMELLQLLLKDPGYGLKFRIVLESIPSWKSKYVQRLSSD